MHSERKDLQWALFIKSSLLRIPVASSFEFSKRGRSRNRYSRVRLCAARGSLYFRNVLVLKENVVACSSLSTNRVRERGRFFFQVPSPWPYSHQQWHLSLLGSCFQSIIPQFLWPNWLSLGVHFSASSSSAWCPMGPSLPWEFSGHIGEYFHFAAVRCQALSTDPISQRTCTLLKGDVKVKEGSARTCVVWSTGSYPAFRQERSCELPECPPSTSTQGLL